MALEKFREHIGNQSSAHNDAQTLYFAYKHQSQSMTCKLNFRKQVMGASYRIRLTARADVIRLILVQGLPFCGNDELEKSLNRGNFLEIHGWYTKQNRDIRKFVKDNAPLNHQLTLQIFKGVLSRLMQQR